jgi:hypothetical protein
VRGIVVIGCRAGERRYGIAEECRRAQRRGRVGGPDGPGVGDGVAGDAEEAALGIVHLGLLTWAGLPHR